MRGISVMINIFCIQSIVSNHEKDFRYLSYNETFDNVEIYENDDEAFDAMAVDQERNQIIIGAKNAIIRLSIEHLSLIERFQWDSTINEMNLCRNHIRSLNECENYVRVLAFHPTDQTLLTCGTNSYQPICIWRRSDSLSTRISTDEIISGVGKCPYNSQYPSVYNLIENGDFYSASRNEPIFGVNDPLIQKSFTRKQLRTQQHDSNWLKNPHFVRILNIGSYIYTFFREISLEHLSCGMNIYSRVARICKYDDGTMKFSDTFRSFSKIRLSCSKKLSNEITSFDYNELQSIYFDSISNLIYAAFNLPKSGLPGSAICVYSIEQLERAFQSAFLSQKSNESFWLPTQTEPQIEKCEPNSSDETYPIRSNHVLRSGILQSSIDSLTFDDIRIGHLLIDQFDDFTILFVFTFDGLWLRKYSLLKNEKLCLIEQIPLKSPTIVEDNWKINQVEFISQTKEILVTTHQSVLKIPVARCHRFSTSHLCSSSMDPYCSWNHHYQQCMFSIDSSARQFRQYLTCPIVNTTIDGGWTSWSSWFDCQQETGETCKCRMRTCTQPKPQANGKFCQGNSIEIERCQTHGGWSTWSSWSECPKTCENSFRIRTRTCTNPRPKNNGRVCLGNEREQELCPQVACANRTSSRNNSQWTKCSKSCGGGIQKRIYSEICREQMRICNEQPCPNQLVTISSNWTKLPIEEKENLDVRMDFILEIANEKKIEIKSNRTIYRICDQKGKNCQQTEQLDHWSPWSNWTNCSPSCSIFGSSETRHRTCLSSHCLGKNLETRNCTSCPNSSSNDWSCWTDWSECSLCTLTKSSSIQSRTRLCLTDSCQGVSYEERSCPCRTSAHQLRFSLLHLIFIGLISFSFGCAFVFCICASKHLKNSLSNPQIYLESETNRPDFHSSSIYLTNGTQFLKDFPSKRLNMYINPTEAHSAPSPPPATTLRRTSMMSSMKTNLDADDL